MTSEERLAETEQRLTELEEKLADLQDDLNTTTPAPPPPPPPPPPRRWAERAQPGDWDALVDWVDNLIADYSIYGNDHIPPCWPTHPGIVEELAALWRAWIAAMIADQTAAGAGATEPSVWHTSHLWPCLTRLGDGQYTTATCRSEKKHWAPLGTPRLTDRAAIPLPLTP